MNRQELEQCFTRKGSKEAYEVIVYLVGDLLTYTVEDLLYESMVEEELGDIFKRDGSGIHYTKSAQAFNEALDIIFGREESNGEGSESEGVDATS